MISGKIHRARAILRNDKREKTLAAETAEDRKTLGDPPVRANFTTELEFDEAVKKYANGLRYLELRRLVIAPETMSIMRRRYLSEMKKMDLPEVLKPTARVTEAIAEAEGDAVKLFENENEEAENTALQNFLNSLGQPNPVAKNEERATVGPAVAGMEGVTAAPGASLPPPKPSFPVCSLCFFEHPAGVDCLEFRKVGAFA